MREKSVMDSRTVLLPFSLFLLVVSTALLYHLSRHPEGLTKSELISFIENDFVRERDGVGRRLGEQIRVGTVEEESGSFALTPLGETVIEGMRFLGAIFGAELPQEGEDKHRSGKYEN